MNVIGVRLDSWSDALLTGAVLAAGCAVLLWLLVPVLARLHARLAEKLLSPPATEALSDRVDTLTETRAGALAAHANELRRIERDLHDGTQARLVAFAMRLGVAERALADDPATTARMLREMRDGNEEAMAELRAVARSIYPPILADRGLAGAIGALAAGCPVPVQTTVDDLGDLPAAVEAAAYFVLAESLTNVAKHSGATAVELRVRRENTVLCLEIVDDGRGGIDEGNGTGLLGIRRRVAVLDGTTFVTSPVGGPTSIRVELPCGS
jgi:signal transduction histidine kinase